MKVTRESRGRQLTAECHADLKVQAETLLKLAAEADTQGQGLKDGAVIEFGWAPLRLRTDGRDLVLCEPDCEGDADKFVPSVDRTLRVVAQQAALLHAVGVEGIAAKYDQGVVLKTGALQLSRIYMHRRDPVSRDDSGWYIGPADDAVPPDDADLDALQVYRLIGLRPQLLKAMALPYDYLVVFDEGEVEAILDEQGKLRTYRSVTG
jgi:hypothetical protein